MRPTWNEYFLGLAKAVAERSDCERSKVGAVVVRDHRVRATGYNGAPSGAPGCSTCPRRLAEAVPGETDYDSGPGRCVAVHAEANALLYCDREDLVGATLYVTREPCYACMKLIHAVGITDIVYPGKDPYLVSFEGSDGLIYTEAVSEDEYLRIMSGQGSTPRRDLAWSLTGVYEAWQQYWDGKVTSYVDLEDHIIRGEN